MSDLNWERMVIVTASHGEKFIGWLSTEVGDPKKYMEEHGVSRKPIVLQDARNLIGQASPSIDRAGNILGVQKFLMLMPIDMLNGPLPTHNLVPSSWYFPSENEPAKKKIEELLRHATETEARLSASEAGIHIPGRTPAP